MNASRLLEIVSLLLEAEEANDVQKRLNEVNTALSNLASAPSDTNHQTAFGTALESLRTALGNVRESFQPAQIKLLQEIDADSYFIDDLAAEIAKLLADSPATPAVAQTEVSALVGDRKDYLAELKKLKDSLEFVRITVDQLEPGEAEIGFLLPREMFENQLENMIEELKVIRRIIRAFMEASTGSVEPIEVRQISTTDPLFFFGMDPATIAMIAGAITWALATWKKVEDIRNVRAQTAKIAALKDEPINEVFAKSIDKTIRTAIDEKAEEIVSQVHGKDPRKNEQRTDLKLALEAILARVERGMTVEVRMLPPTIETNDDEPPAPPPQHFDDIRTLSSQMIFPKMEGEPILKLSSSESEKAEAPRRKTT